MYRKPIGDWIEDIGNKKSAKKEIKKNKNL